MSAARRPTQARAGLSADAPGGLAEAVVERHARVLEGWREAARAYLRLDAPEGPLFARWSSDPDDRAVLEYEARVRAAIGSERGALRTPAVIAHGRGWLLEQRIEAKPLSGEQAASASAAAATELTRIDLPAPPEGLVREARSTLLWRRLRTARSALPIRDWTRARRLVETIDLPRAASHGDFHPGNLLVSDDVVWVVDWEHADRRPLGFDHMQLWVTLPDLLDRERVLQAATALVGPDRLGDLLRLRYVVAVRTIVGMLAATKSFNRDEREAHRLLDELPWLHAEAAEAPRR